MIAAATAGMGEGQPTRGRRSPEHKRIQELERELRRKDKALAEASGLSRERVKALIAEGAVTVAGARVSQPSGKAAQGAPFAIAVPPAAEPAARFIAGGTNILDLMKENVARAAASDRSFCLLAGPLDGSDEILLAFRADSAEPEDPDALRHLLRRQAELDGRPDGEPAGATGDAAAIGRTSSGLCPRITGCSCEASVAIEPAITSHHVSGP